MKVTLYYYTVSGGDGSAFPQFFSTKEKRDRYMELTERGYSEFFCEADGEITINVDEDGKITPATKYTNLDVKHRDDKGDEQC